MTLHLTLHSHSDSTRCHLIRHLWQSDAGLDLSKLDIGSWLRVSFLKTCETRPVRNSYCFWKIFKDFRLDSVRSCRDLVYILRDLVVI